MADTRGSFSITEDGWISVQTLTGIATGTELFIQNQSNSQFYLAISPSQPTEDFRGLIVPADTRVISKVTSGESAVWIKGKGRINIQEGV